ncbi:5151_t:CDS:2 [Acaulospora morrowiae]|uniref:5151_t:CDS:1 n=1 Tax=Acaulospora morrowiae TaxID=94023 RepID=A0A9N8YMC5_9GLOM|nr:5151_t:CDS:2 [Acaulospora morrowiae]
MSSATTDYISETSNVTSDAIAIVQTFTSQSAVVADAISPFIPLVAEVANLVNEIIQIYQTAEHNKRICGSLLSRATAAETSVNLLKIRRSEYEESFKSKEFYINLQKLVTVIEKIKNFIKEVSQIKGLRRFMSARSIEGEFQDLIEEFDGLMRVLNFTMAVKNQIQAEEDKKVLDHDIKEMKKYLKKIKGGIVNSMSEINASLDDIAQLNIAWQKKLFNDDGNVLESVTINMGEFQDPPEQIRRGNKVHKKIRMGEEVAIKEIILINNDKRLINDIISQVVILKKLKESQYILQFYGITKDANAIYMVSEWCEYGNLREFYNEYGPLEWRTKSQLAVDISRGLTFLHAVSILHHDIRPENILVSIHHQAKIANFTLSRGFADPTRDISPTIGTIKWMAPEKLRDHRNPYTIKCEIYSFGILLWEIAEEKPPFQEERDLLEIRKKVLELKIRPSFSTDVPQEWSKTSYQAMQDNPNARPALKDIFMALHSFCQKYQSRSPRPHPPGRMPTEEELPDVDEDLALDDLSLNVMSLKEAITEHRKKDSDKLKVWEAFKVHAEEFGDITARYWMGYYLYYGLCPVENPGDKEAKKQRLKQAASLFKEAADKGIVEAQLRYGHCLWSGEGVQRNYKEAIEYFAQSADNGNSTAMYNIGNVYYNGLAVPKDEKKGVRYLRLAALQGQTKALDMCKKNGIHLA